MKQDYSKTLFNDCATACEAYSFCGGVRPTAPCLCVHPKESPLRYQCNKCEYFCRERGMNKKGAKAKVKTIEDELASGLMLCDVSLTQHHFDLPVFIPEDTHQLHDAEKFTEWVAVDIKALFNFPRQKGAIAKTHLRNETTFRKFLNVSRSCKLIAVLNGTDKMLESFWASNRRTLIKRLATLGFSACTAPTYSINRLTTVRTPVPFLHHAMMLMRHHRVLSEINEYGLCAIPNLYTLDGDLRHMNEWATWLKNNPKVETVSRDFTSTRQWEAIEPKLKDLIQTLTLAGRAFQVLIVGTGSANAMRIATELTKAGHKPTFITAAPILKAIKGGMYELANTEKLTVVTNHEIQKSELMRHNMKVFVYALTTFINKVSAA